jgi:arylformamidase
MGSVTRHLIDLTHPLHDGLATHPGLPGPRHTVFRSRQEYQDAGGMPFQIDRMDLVGNTGTYLDSPFHRFWDGPDLGALPLSAVADLPVVLVDARERDGRAVDVALLQRQAHGGDLAGSAVLLWTGGDAHWAQPGYAQQAPYLSGPAARWLTDRAPALVGIDAVNIDDLDDATRPAHTTLLGAGVLVLEHLTGLSAVPATGSRLHAAPLPWRAVGTWPVRAYVVAGEA